MNKEIHKNRIEKLVKILKEHVVSGYISGLSDNLYYFSNYYGIQYERFFALVVTTDGEAILVVPKLEKDQVRNTTWIENIVTWADGEDPFEKIYSIFKEKKLLNSKIAVDNTLRSDFLLALQEKLPQVCFIVGSNFSNILRRVKSAEEKNLMMNVGSIQDKVYDKVIASINAGISEMYIADLILSTFKELGSKCSSPLPIVASGQFSAQPHYRATNKIISIGDSIVMDCGGDLDHYKSDMTRTVFVGKPSKEFLTIYDIVRKAQETAFKSVKPGRTCEEIDQVARDIIEKEGYGKYFIHRTGHGIGLESHEEPYIVKGNKLILEPGMTFSIEPGIYLPGKFGVRIEDCVIVTETGAEAFTHFTHDLITI